jgi:hypothetical protein
MSATTTADEFVPVPRPQQRGRCQRWIAEELEPEPGVWKLYPFPVAQPDNCRRNYPRTHPGTEWELDADGRLGARWVGFDDDDEAA